MAGAKFPAEWSHARSQLHDNISDALNLADIERGSSHKSLAACFRIALGPDTDVSQGNTRGDAGRGLLPSV
jgi:hypothetical protein